jgi:hypothetical protein
MSTFFPPTLAGLASLLRFAPFALGIAAAVGCSAETASDTNSAENGLVGCASDGGAPDASPADGGAPTTCPEFVGECTIDTGPADLDGDGCIDGCVALAVRGNILFPTGFTSTSGAPATIEVLDTSYADAPSVAIGRVATTVTGSVTPFAVPITGVRSNRSYTVHVHVDVDGNGAISNGDYITMESFPVLTQGHPSVVAVTVQPVP